MSNKDEVNVDADRLWAAISRSKQFQQLVQRVADDIKDEAERLANAQARDEGYYARSFQAGTGNAKRVRALAYAPSSKGSKSGKALRFQQGIKGTNRFLDVQLNGDTSAKPYDGELGVVVNTDFKAAMIEYGTAAKGPRRIMLAAAQNVAQRLGLEVEVIYDTTNQQNISKLSAAIRAGRRNGKKPVRKKKGGAT